MSEDVAWWVLGLLVVGAIAVGVAIQRSIDADDRREGVRARFMDLRITADRLIAERPRTMVYPLAGLVARVEDAAHGRSVYLSITGPRVMLLRELPYSKDRRAGFAARAFAEKLNLQARQL